MARANIIGIGKVNVHIMETNGRYTEVSILEGVYEGKRVCVYHDSPVEWVSGSPEETIRHIFNKYFTGVDDYDRSDVSAVMSEKIVECLELEPYDFNFSKLSRGDKENITGLDYRESCINTNYIRNYHSIEAMHYVLQNYVLDRLSGGKNIKKQLKKWINF